MTFLRKWMREWKWEWCFGLDGHQDRAAHCHQILVTRGTYCRTNSANVTGYLWRWCLCSFEHWLVDSCLWNWPKIHCRRPSIWEVLSQPYWNSNSLITKRQPVVFSPNSCSGALHFSKYGAAMFTWVFVLFTASLSLGATFIDGWVKTKVCRIL
jgi:hypothetical protein